MADEELLDRLASHLGIEPSYIDIWGTRHEVSRKTKRALVEAMGVAADERSLQTALEEREVKPWLSPLPPVRVVRESAFPFHTYISLPESALDNELEWNIYAESGDRRSGRLRAAELEVIERRKIKEKDYVRLHFRLPENPGLGYHRLEISCGEVSAAMSLIVAPDMCYTPSALQGDGRVWGPAVQLYALRSGRDWGMGDYTDLKTLVDYCSDLGADIIGLNPLHALFPHNPEHCGPYSPSSRLFLNTLYLDIENIAEYSENDTVKQMTLAPEFQRRLRAARESELVDYKEVAVLKAPALEVLYKEFRARHLDSEDERGRAFRAFQAEGGEDLFLHALFEALQERFHREDEGVWGWQAWPKEYHNPASPAVARFAEENRDRIEFFQYLQWQADLQMEETGHRALERRLGVGLYIDLAVSVDRAGAEAWAHQDIYAVGAGIGAPPDDFNLNGQDWGLAPLIPDHLRDKAYAPFISILRRNMKYAGALRVDHVMGLMRQFWVPAGSPPQGGAYVHYHFDDLLGVLALESYRNRCLIVGEDLGTVPDEVRHALAPMGVLSYRLLYFEKDADGEFKRPEGYPTQAAAAVTTHDLPTLCGYWEGKDLALREELDLFPSSELREGQTVERARDRARLLVALNREELLPDGVELDPVYTPKMTQELARAVHKYLGKSPSKMVMVQLEDVFGETDQVNMPGSVSGYPNWRRKIAIGLEEMARDTRLLDLAADISAERKIPKSEWAVEKRGLKAHIEAVIPRVTYRLQLNNKFTFAQAKELVPYLDDLGISHVYTSPCLKARAGSSHGYDIVDHGSLNPEIGSEDDYRGFISALRQREIGQIMDIVPNHMGVMGADNKWWLDVLENGPASEYASYFDIDWAPVKKELSGKALIPILADHYGGALEKGELVLVFDPAEGSFSVWYHNHRFPIDPGVYPIIMRRRTDTLEARLGPDSADIMEYMSLVTAFEHLPPRTEQDAGKQVERSRDKGLNKKRLARLCATSGEIRRHIDENVAEFNGRKDEPSSFELLHRLLESQAYRLAHWRVAGDEINYRRFFDINDLASIRVEDERVFEASHRLVLEFVKDGSVQGLRIDHPDGLYDPPEYYGRLLDRINTVAAAPEGARPVYLLAEKILAGYEQLPEDWPIHGTTGYDFANEVNGLFVNPSSEKQISRIYERFIGGKLDFTNLLYELKKKIMSKSMASELNVLANKLNQVSEADWKTRDFTLNGLRDALSEVVACFPVYRTYVAEGRVTEQDRYYVNWAIAQAKRKNAGMDTTVFDFISSVLLLSAGENRDEEYRRSVTDFAMRFQQYTAPVMAKGMEDTAFYNYNRLVSLNEVGGDPRRFGVSVSAFHRVNQERARRWPYSMLGSSTHDTKRSEDVRARINAITEFPDEWRKSLSRWSRLNRSRKKRVDNELAPGRNDEYLLYQILVGAWPLGELDEGEIESFKERIKAYMLKAVREAKERTSWTHPNEEYESAVTGFVDSALASPSKNAFLKEFIPFQEKISRAGMFNSLSQLTLKLTAPGVPDIYQGTEMWDFSLADPDNRRPVDYDERKWALGELKAMAGHELLPGVRSLLENMEDGRVKMYLLWRAAQARREDPELFKFGEYMPLAVEGAKADHVVAYARKHHKRSLIVVAPRLIASVMDVETALPIGDIWGDAFIHIPLDLKGETYINVMTGENIQTPQRDGEPAVKVSDILKNFPVALLMSA